MGFSSGGGANATKSEINVTPLVDVVLVLLIIFLITMPVVMRTVTLEVPRKADESEDTTAKQIVIVVKADGTIDVNDGEKEHNGIPANNLAKTIRPVLDKKKGEKVVFVDFEDPVIWSEVVSTMDKVRSIAEDTDHNEIKVALKKREDLPDGAAP